MDIILKYFNDVSLFHIASHFEAEKIYVSVRYITIGPHEFDIFEKLPLNEKLRQNWRSGSNLFGIKHSRAMTVNIKRCPTECE